MKRYDPMRDKGRELYGLIHGKGKKLELKGCRNAINAIYITRYLQKEDPKDILHFHIARGRTQQHITKENRKKKLGLHFVTPY